MNYYCNPINVDYLYQFYQNRKHDNRIEIAREAADPSMIEFDGKYYIFASMTLGVWVSDNLADWENHRLPAHLPLYDYAPDVRVIDDYVYFSASKSDEICNFYRTKDILNGPYEEIVGSFDFWDPNLFEDEDKKVYLYWGCSNSAPVWGVELDKETMHPIGDKVEVIFQDTQLKGFERKGENHSIQALGDTELEERFQEFLKEQNVSEDSLPTQTQGIIKSMLSNRPYIEGAWMTKHNGKYYLQYACPGTQYNVYADGTYISDSPLGPFTLAKNNPYSYKPGGFITGAGHGSTMKDLNGNFWHTSTMRISMNHQFERRVGIWPAGFDKDGELFCNQNYGDWPRSAEKTQTNPWADPDWYLLSYKKRVSASSFEAANGPDKAVDENIQTWWKSSSAKSGEWLLMDLGKAFDVRAVQINFADDQVDTPVPGTIIGESMPRYIEESPLVTRWILEGSMDGTEFFVIEDKSSAKTSLPHDLIVRDAGIEASFLKLTLIEVPYNQKFCVSGFRVFGIGDGEKPSVPNFQALRIGDIDMEITIEKNDAVGYNILWGHSPEKMYHSYQTFDNKQGIGALVKGQEVYVRVDSFNENGITVGTLSKLDS